MSNIIKFQLQSKLPNCVFVLTNERYTKYQTGFPFCHLGHALGVGLGGVKNSIRPVRLSVMLSPKLLD